MKALISSGLCNDPGPPGPRSAASGSYSGRGSDPYARTVARYLWRKCVRGFEVALYAEVKAQAKAEGMLIKDWIERALIHELVRSRQQPLRLKADLGEKAAEG